ncbi:pyridoxal phosphate-dependent aminotransferase [Candidatus Litorirhabdus singularis]|nr:pyridoxal phosphate-dependent aminotransferase [Candidatus Litorirhabdus singularis]
MLQRLQQNLRDTQHSETLLVNQIANQRAAEDKPIFRFGFGQSPFPVPEHVVAALRVAAHRKEYLDVQGLPELRSTVAKFHSARQTQQWSSEQVVIGAGSKILLFCLLAAVQNADVALVAPGWVSYEPQARLAGHRVYHLQTELEQHWRVTPEMLEQFCSQRRDLERPLFLILNYPGNPDGLTYSGEQLAALANVLRKHGVMVISDEIYGLLHHRGQHVSIADYYPEGTMITSGLSKWCGAGGWRLGIAHIPVQLGADYMQRVIGVCSETFSCAPAPIQHAAVVAYTEDERLHQFLQQQRSILADTGQSCAQSLRQAGVAVHDPEGGFYLFPDFSAYRDKLAACGITSGAELTQTILEDTGVTLLPGSAFGMPESSLTARLAYVDFDGSQALANGNQYHSNMEEGIKRLCNWLQTRTPGVSVASG